MESLDTAQSLAGKVEQLSKLLDVARFMAVERDLNQLLDYIAKQVTAGLQADRCAIFLLDENQGEIWSKVALGTSEIRFPKDLGLAGHTIRTGEVLLIPDAYQDPRFNRSIDEKTGYKTHNLLCVPLKNLDSKTIGCFQVVNKLTGDFSQGDQDYLLAFGAQAAVSIESAQLYREKLRVIKALEERNRQLEVVYHLEKSLNETHEFDSFMQGVIQKATEALNSDAGSILLLDEHSNRILFAYRTGTAAEELKKIQLETNEGIAGYVVSTGLPVLENDAGRNPLHSHRVEEAVGVTTRNLVAVPLTMVVEGDPSGAEQNIGAIEVINHHSGDFTSDDLSVLQIISAQITSGIIRKKLLEEREKSQRLATIGTLASTIIHDFKNPMAIIRGYGELMTKLQMPQEKRDKFCKVIVAEVDRCVNMTKELLYFARGEKNYNFEMVPVPTFIEDIALVLENEMQSHKIDFRTELDYRGPLKLDQDKMKRVIFNLSNNAMGVLKEGDAFSIRCQKVDGTVEIRVSDTGPGIPPEIRPKLFGAFVTHGKKDGTGLGLCIAKDIVEGHGGRIFLDEAVTRGATFVIQLKEPEQSHPGS